MERRRTLDLQLEAVSDALTAAQEEQDPHRQDELLAVIYRAWVAYLRAHRALLEEEERQRRHLRLVPAAPPSPPVAGPETTGRLIRLSRSATPARIAHRLCR